MKGKREREIIESVRVFDQSNAADFERYVRLRADIVKVIGEYVRLNRRGRHYIARCPFHPNGVDKELAVYPDRQLFLCWSAGCSSGDVFDFVAKLEKVSRQEAIHILARKLGISANLFEETPPAVDVTEFRISFSALKLFQQCPLRYKYRYIDHKKDQKTTSYLAVGRILHKVLAEFFKVDAEKRSLDLLLNMLDDNWKVDGFATKKEAEESKIGTKEMLTAYFLSTNLAVNTWRVEAPVKCNIGGLAIAGVVDRIDTLADGSYEVIDYKTEPLDSSGQNEMQLAFYYYGVMESYHLPISKLTLEYLPSKETISLSPLEVDLQQYIMKACKIASEIQGTEDFKPKRNMYCADCIFASSCSELRPHDGTQGQGNKGAKGL